MAVIRVTTEWLLSVDKNRYTLPDGYLGRSSDHGAIERRDRMHALLRATVPQAGMWLADLAKAINLREPSIRPYTKSGYLNKEWRYSEATKRNALWITIA